MRYRKGSTVKSHTKTVRTKKSGTKTVKVKGTTRSGGLVARKPKFTGL